jgi:hypothetical protein
MSERRAAAPGIDLIGLGAVLGCEPWRVLEKLGLDDPDSRAVVTALLGAARKAMDARAALEQAVSALADLAGSCHEIEAAVPGLLALLAVSGGRIRRTTQAIRNADDLRAIETEEVPDDGGAAANESTPDGGGGDCEGGGIAARGDGAVQPAGI